MSKEETAKPLGRGDDVSSFCIAQNMKKMFVVL